MPIKLTGAEFNRFYNDKEVWTDGLIHEEEEIWVDGVEIEEYSDFSTIDDTSVVRVSGGVIYHEDEPRNEKGSFEGLLRKWRKSQDTEFMAVEVPKSKADAVREAIKAAGGKVVK